ncbi:hypothetical protein [Neptunomonas japonica]|uniref:Uncharacterized protein n=1 Tax=Neptunomonas japonica JAMM 1380 TaxID=1441457 RepID=A0A7R6PCP3_9GAMM|nr:hypothetical protein [Neptunomonas japonica]BBB30069.1 conserved hypothetical protein [Neptunomonas japonica JAMM 1380]
MSNEDTKIKRDFFARDDDEQQAFLSQTWCDNCQAADLGMHTPLEYELDGTIFVEGSCNKCGEQVFTELTEDDL